MASFDISQARARFPALKQDQVYLGNAGATYKTSKASIAAYANAYEGAAKFINASLSEVCSLRSGANQICLGVSTTQLLHNLPTALQSQPGDELVLSKLNHEADTAPWARIAERLGLKVKWWSATDPQNPVCDLDELQELLSEKTRLVACPHVSNVTGTITRVKEIATLVHRYPRALLCVDGVALAPHREVDVKDIGVDFYVFSWYKVYGPHIAQLYASSRIHDQISSLGHFFKGAETLDSKLNLASASYEATQSTPAVVEYLGANPTTTWDKIVSHEGGLQRIRLDFLNSEGRITVYGERSASTELRVPVVSFTVPGTRSQRVVVEVESRSSFGFRSGPMYSYRLVDEIIGLKDVEDGVVRISMLHYNTEEEIRGLVGVLKEVINSLPGESQ
ncbi:putative aminotransferase [Aspergillus clavatus NRRL 1]|uniref:Aminotransferase, putative n=1 Tax=Aspergillus clavatus (strain ATCC 1007 / CBS 513.65 / DSM 816 / NCTC 3887 / NRRL 1 / QM 1276 / 107) TaxID=344612 RepID=A1CMX2_ASPCL|nr:aminotransferase, putative [Aspergillus clavatus NRRL 1]EAW08909.1 aminotransferase, putative [Aspergillus clavatus NRRL 1]